LILKYSQEDCFEILNVRHEFQGRREKKNKKIGSMTIHPTRAAYGGRGCRGQSTDMVEVDFQPWDNSSHTFKTPWHLSCTSTGWACA